MDVTWGFLILVAVGVAIAAAVTRRLVVSRRAAGGRVTGSWLPLVWLCVAGAVGLGLIITLVGPRQDFPGPSPQEFQSAIEQAGNQRPPAA